MKLFKRLLKTTIFLIFFEILLISLIYAYAKMSPKVEIKQNNSYYLYDLNDEVFFQGKGTNSWVSIDDISEYLKKATIIIEDKNFYNHHGFNILRIMKAAFNNL
ncbi:MAG: transglycosylase domain-containing protein [Bacilli bacterium]|nr:transglycosylase domain-containing protein [Bacilli bacterium]